MKISIIGAGNMGGAIARALAKSSWIATDCLWVTAPHTATLDRFTAEFPEMHVTTENQRACNEADFIVLAVKPWLVQPVLKQLTFRPNQVLISVAAGVSFEQLKQELNLPIPLYRVVPNTAATYQESMTLVASCNTTSELDRQVVELFDTMGRTMLIPESQIAATTALTSCGIALVLKYIQAAMQAGIEMGIYPKEARQMVAQSVKGAAELILQNPEAHPSTEIDKVTTPGGLTIKGINELEHAGFTSAVIQALKACR